MSRQLYNITLGAPAIAMCLVLAERRNLIKEAMGVRSQKFDTTKGELDAHIDGVLTEYATAQFLGVEMDTSASPSGDDKITDLLFRGWRVQVKGRSYQGPGLELFFNSLGNFKAEIAVCAQIKSWTSISLVGWISRPAFREKHRTKDYGYGTRFYVTEGDLNPMPELLKIPTNPHQEKLSA
jgi:hypothetical protein